MLVLLAAAATAAPTDTSMFAFVGQPDCVQLAYADGQTALLNRCEHALLLDQSVQLHTTTQVLVPPAASTTIRDLSAFTIGMNGELYRVVATLRAPPKLAR